MSSALSCLVIFTAASRLYPRNSPGHWCDVCHERIKSENGKAWRCKLCNFDLCRSCYDKKVGTRRIVSCRVVSWCGAFVQSGSYFCSDEILRVNKQKNPENLGYRFTQQSRN